MCLAEQDDLPEAGRVSGLAGNLNLHLTMLDASKRRRGLGAERRPLRPCELAKPNPGFSANQ